MSEPLPIADVEPDAGPSAEDVRLVRDLAERAKVLAQWVSDAEAELTRVKGELKLVVERDLPGALTQARMTVWPMPGGYVYELATTTSASIPKPLVERAHGWLEEHGHGDLIKRKFTILFGRDELPWARKFMADCMKRKKPLKIDRKDWVEPQTLGAFVREQRREAAARGEAVEAAVPVDLFGVYEVTYAKLVPPKENKL